jgi:hypothetical protein
MTVASKATTAQHFLVFFRRLVKNRAGRWAFMGLGRLKSLSRGDLGTISWSPCGDQEMVDDVGIEPTTR